MKTDLMLIISAFFVTITNDLSQTSAKNNKTVTEMSTFELTSNGELKITASKKSSKNDFDFLAGFHKVHHKKLKTRLNHCTEWIESDGTQEMRQVLSDIGNVDSYYMTALDGESIEGMALRLFNPATRLWTIYWADSHH